ncbi:hypothetical protein AAGW05_03020 [Arthrobacter sp. LAPM80]|uniref:hypothetical protein n=1 Tax=Arthrobacter sp. LAPM80 TaxID=3141788 RepID=UPI00398B3F89
MLGAVALAICTLFAVNLVLTGTASSIRHYLPWLLLVAWALYLLFWRPCLLIRVDGLGVHNILRDHDIPFSELTGVRVLQSVSFDTAAGRIASWGAPGAGKLGPRMHTGPDGARTMGPLPHTQSTVQSAWDAWERRQPIAGTHDGGSPIPGNAASQPGPQATVTTRWNAPAAVVGVLLAALAIAGALM